MLIMNNHTLVWVRYIFQGGRLLHLSGKYSLCFKLKVIKKNKKLNLSDMETIWCFYVTSSGYLSVCLSSSWKERWCVLRDGNLYLQKDPGDQRPPVVVVPLKGAEVVPGGLGPKHPFSFCITQGGNKLAALEVWCLFLSDWDSQRTLLNWHKILCKFY